MTRFLWIAALALPLAACDSGDDPEPTGDTEVELPPIVSVTGMTSELFSPQTKAPEGLCVHAVDPSAALEGGDINVLASSTVGADGSYTITDVDVSKAPLAIFVIVQDCNNEGTVFPAGTGIAADTYASSVNGDTLERNPTFFVSAASAAGIDASFAAAGSTKTLAGGAVLGFVLDSTGAPVGGATVGVTGQDDVEVYYVDGEAADGLFTSATTGVNAATQDGIGLTVIPEGPVGNYEINKDGMEWEGGLFGSISGLAAVIAWTAE